MAKQTAKTNEPRAPKAPKVPASKKLNTTDQSPTEQPIAQTVPATVQVSKPGGPAQRLGKGLWGIVGSKTRYSTVTQFSGLEYVRYEYRLIPEQYRDAALKSEFLDVVEITEEPEFEEVIETGEEGEISEEAGTKSDEDVLTNAEDDQTGETSTPAAEGSEDSKG
jgi:hypothetical protein